MNDLYEFSNEELNMISIILYHAPIFMVLILLSEISWSVSMIYWYFEIEHINEIWDWWFPWMIWSFIAGVVFVIVGYIVASIIKFVKEANHGQ